MKVPGLFWLSISALVSLQAQAGEASRTPAQLPLSAELPALTAGAGAPVSSNEPAQEEKKFNLRVSRASVQSILEILVKKAGFELQTEADLGELASLNLSGVTFPFALGKIAEEHHLTYYVQGKTVFFKKSGSSKQTAPGANRVAASGGTTGNAPRKITASYYSANTLMTQLQGVIDKDEVLLLDEPTNSIIFQGSDHSYEKILGMVALLDQMPRQVQIEARVVETSKIFSESLGLSWGINQPANGAGQAKLNGSLNRDSSNVLGNYRIGTLIGANLDVSLAAAESNGTAKVISRPRVVTLNNTRASIHSGVSYHVRTLTAVSTGGTGSSVNLNGGIQTIDAGLQLNVTPLIMGKDLVKLDVKINNSHTDESSMVDGIPGIIDNAATTTVIVGQGRTAVIAGLIKNSKANSDSGVPFLSSIPLIGALFRNHTDSDQNNELVIFLTPRVVDPTQDLAAEPAPVIDPDSTDYSAVKKRPEATTEKESRAPASAPLPVSAPAPAPAPVAARSGVNSPVTSPLKCDCPAECPFGSPLSPICKETPCCILQE